MKGCRRSYLIGIPSLHSDNGGICALRLHIPCHCRGGPCKKKGLKLKLQFSYTEGPFENKFSRSFCI